MSAWNSGSDSGSVSRLGNASNNSPDNTNRALFLKQFAGEVLTSFEEKNVFMPLHRVRTISNGKSAQFPSIGTSSAHYHQAGQTIYGGSVPASEITVTVDDLLVSSTFIPKIDEAMNHYDVRSIYSKEMGMALSNAADKHIAATIYKAATGAGTGDQETQWADGDAAWAVTSSDEKQGVIPFNTGGAYTAANVVDGILQALELFDANDVTGEKFCVVTPEVYYKVMGADTVAINRDTGGNGSTAQGIVPSIGGVKLIMSNHLPTSDTSISNSVNENGSATDYNDNMAGLGGLIFTRDAAATVKLLDLGVESEYQIERQGTLMVAKYAMGHNVLRNKAAIAFTTAANS